MASSTTLHIGWRCPMMHKLWPRAGRRVGVTKAQRAHWKLHSLECSGGREVLSRPQDLPSIETPLGGLALCAAPSATLWVSQGAPQTTHPVHPSGVQSRAEGNHGPNFALRAHCGRTAGALRGHCGHMYQRPPKGEGARKRQACGDSNTT